MKLPALILVAIALGVGGCGSDGESANSPGTGSGAGSGTTPGPAKDASLKGSPPQLAAVHRQANELLGGGAEAFEARLAKLKGHPVVVNKWASWCPPCKAEFPFFANQAITRGRKIAFIGVDSSDNDADAAEFLRENPVSYPSYKDPDLKVAAVFNGAGAFPSTAFYDSDGKLAYLKQGSYPTEQKLAEDVDRYAR